MQARCRASQDLSRDAGKPSRRPCASRIVFVVSAPLLWLVHVTFLNQPEDRGVFYGIFWGIVVGLILLLATRSEKMRRAGLTGDEQDREPPDLSVPDRPDELFVVVDDRGEPIGTATRGRLPLGSLARPPLDPRGRADARRRCSGSCADRTRTRHRTRGITRARGT